MKDATISDVLSGKARWCVIQGDCLEVLPTLPDKSTAVVTDPPYDVEAHTKARRQTKTHEVAEYEIDFAPLTEEIRVALGVEFARVCRSWALVFSQVESVRAWKDACVSAGGKWRKAGIWVKPDAAPQFTGDQWAQGYECINAAWFGKGRSEWNGGGRRNVFSFNVNDFGRLTSGREHPTMKPVPLMLDLVELFTDPDETICDPFAGSGTTGVACLRLGRRFIGIEKDPKYAAIARERLAAESQGLTLRDARVGQRSLFEAGT